MSFPSISFSPNCFEEFTRSNDVLKSRASARLAQLESYPSFSSTLNSESESPLNCQVAAPSSTIEKNVAGPDDMVNGADVSESIKSDDHGSCPMCALLPTGSHHCSKCHHKKKCTSLMKNGKHHCSSKEPCPSLAQCPSFYQYD